MSMFFFNHESILTFYPLSISPVPVPFMVPPNPIPSLTGTHMLPQISHPPSSSMIAKWCCPIQLVPPSGTCPSTCLSVSHVT